MLCTPSPPRVSLWGRTLPPSSWVEGLGIKRKKEKKKKHFFPRISPHAFANRTWKGQTPAGLGSPQRWNPSSTCTHAASPVPRVSPRNHGSLSPPLSHIHTICFPQHAARGTETGSSPCSTRTAQRRLYFCGVPPSRGTASGSGTPHPCHQRALLPWVQHHQAAGRLCPPQGLGFFFFFFQQKAKRVDEKRPRSTAYELPAARSDRAWQNRQIGENGG